MDEAIQRELELIKEGILQTVPAQAIYLFGSYAYGIPHKDSDLDIYVVVPDDLDGHLLEMNAEILDNLYKKTQMPIDLMVNRASIFKRRSQGPTLQRTIANKGVMLYGA